MPSSGARKAAQLLVDLDPGTAGELLKSADEQTMKEIVAELAWISSSGRPGGGDGERPVREFSELVAQKDRNLSGQLFLDALLDSAVGKDRAEEVRREASELVRAREPFSPIRSADVEHIASALAGEPPMVAAMVLSELPPGKAAKLLPLLDEEVRPKAVMEMTSGRSANPDIRLRIARQVCSRLEALKWQESGGAQQKESDAQRKRRLRSVAVILQGLSSELCEALLEGLNQTDPETCKLVRNLMLIWEDIPRVADRSLQEALRTQEPQTLAMALYEAQPRIAKKIRSNISERVAALVDEELSLLSSPKPEKILEARETILEVLRDMNAKGELTLEEA
ncbi:MAG: FliG C-terminal domain-containing protein [Phycisphaerae bacterium]